MTEKTAGTRPAAGADGQAAGAGAAAEFERIYRANVDAVSAYFARRTADPQLVADLTADTFVAVITHFGSFDPRKGTARAWVFGIARHVYASYCEAYSQQQHKLRRLAGRRDLDADQVEELLERIDAERAGRDLLTGLAALPERDRAVIELVDIAGLRPKEAAAALGLTPGTVRMRLMRTRARLRKQAATRSSQNRNRSGVTGMTKFADQLFDDLMREHGPALARTRPPAPRRHIATRRTLLAAGTACAAVAATAGALVASGGTPAYAVTTNPNGTVTLAVYQKSGIAGANARLRQLGDGQVVVVPVKAGCPSLGSLPAPAVPLRGHIPTQTTSSRDGSVTVKAKGIPAGDILVVGFETTAHGGKVTSVGGGKLTSPPAPSCVSLPQAPGTAR